MKPHNKARIDALEAALAALLTWAEVNDCSHDETHRGGAIWTICNGCGRMWADDRTPFIGYKEPKEFEAARKALTLD